MQRDVLEQRELTREEIIALKNKRTGLFIFQLSWILVFVCLSVVNLSIRGSYTSWPPPGVEKMGLGLPTIATGLLIISGVFARRGLQAMAADNHLAFSSHWRNALALGVLFIIIMAYEWITAPMGTQYGTIFRVMTAFHAIHSLVVGIYMYNIYRSDTRYGSHEYWPVEAGAKLWYFVAIAWVLFYLVLYWI